MYRILSSQLLFNVLDSIFSFMTGFAENVLYFFVYYFQLRLGMLLYTIGAALMSLIDMLQIFFNKLAGIEPHYVNGVETDSDILLTFLSDESVLNVLLGMLILSVFLVIIMTIVQIVRSEYTSQGAKNTKGNIIGLTVKSFIMFLTVPATVALGIYASNFILQSVYAAFGGGTSSYIAGAVFNASAGDAGKILKVSSVTEEYGDNIYSDAISTLYGLGMFNSENNGFTDNYDNGGRFTSSTTSNTEKTYEIAELVNLAFANKETNYNTEGLASNALFDNYSYNNVALVAIYYDVLQVDYITMYASAVFCLYVLLVSSFGLIMRVFKTVMLFIISPPIISIMPIDGGKAYQNWRTQFLGAVLGAYGVIVAMNSFFLVITVMDKSNITFFSSGALSEYFGYNYYMRLLFMLVGLYMVKDMSKLISGLVGSGDGDVFNSGAGMAKKVGSTIAKTAGAIATGGAWAAGGMKLASMKTAAQGKIKGYASKIDNTTAQMANYDPNSAEYKQLAAQKSDLLSKRNAEYNNLQEIQGGLDRNKLAPKISDFAAKKFLAKKDGMKSLKQYGKKKYIDPRDEASEKHAKRDAKMKEYFTTSDESRNKAASLSVAQLQAAASKENSAIGAQADLGKESTLKATAYGKASRIDKHNYRIGKAIDYYNAAEKEYDVVSRKVNKTPEDTQREKELLSRMWEAKDEIEDRKDKIAASSQDNERTEELLLAILNQMKSTSPVTSADRSFAKEGLGEIADKVRSQGDKSMKVAIANNIINNLDIDSDASGEGLYRSINDAIEKEFAKSSRKNQQDLKSQVTEIIEKTIKDAMEDANK